MDRPSEFRPVSERKALEDLLDDIREVLADREERAKQDAPYRQAACLEELEAIGKAIQRIADRRGLRWGPAETETEAFLDGFEDLADTEVDPDEPIPYRLVARERP